MARPLPVNLLLAATGSVLLVSGIGGKSLGEVLKGNFGSIEVKKPNIGEPTPQAAQGAGATSGEAGVTTPVASGEGGAFAPSPTSFSGSTLAPPPVQAGRHPTKKQQAQGIALILASKGIRNPTTAQINQARREYEQQTGVSQFTRAGEGAQEFVGGLPVV